MTAKDLKWVFAFLAVLLVALNLSPLFTLLGRLITGAAEFSLLWGHPTLTAVQRTVGIGVASTLLTCVFCVPVAWCLVRTNLPGRLFFRKVLLLPFLLPPYLFAIAWISIAVPQVGMFNRLLGQDIFNIYRPSGLVWVLFSAYFPVVLSTLIRTLEVMDPSLEEAGRIAGARPLKVFTSITFPCLLPTIASSALLFQMEVMSAFGIPALIGGPARYMVLTTLIYGEAKMGGLGGLNNAVVIALWLLLVTVVFVLINDQLRKRFQYRLTSGKVPRPSLFRLHGWAIPMACLFGLFVLVLILLPMASIVLSSFFRIAGQMEISNLTWENYRYLATMPELFRAIVNSSWLSLLTCLVCLAVGFFIAYFKDRTRLPGRDFLQKIAILPFAVPGTLIALGILISFGSGWGIDSIALMGSSLLLLFAYLAKYMAIAVQSLLPALSNIDPSLDEAARVAGASRWKMIAKVLVPLLRPSFSAVFFLTFLPVFSELTMSVLLAGPGSETIGTLLFQLHDYANPLAACSLASLIVGIVVIGWSLLSVVEKVRR